MRGGNSPGGYWRNLVVCNSNQGTKILIADLMVMASWRMKEIAKFLRLLKKSRYAISDRSLWHWQQQYHEGRPAVLAHHISPRSRTQTAYCLGFQQSGREKLRITRTASVEVYAKYLNEIARTTLRSNPSDLDCSIDFTFFRHFPDAQRKLSTVNSYVRVQRIVFCSMLSSFFLLNIYAKSDFKLPFRFSNQGCSWTRGQSLGLLLLVIGQMVNRPAVL